MTLRPPRVTCARIVLSSAIATALSVASAQAQSVQSIDFIGQETFPTNYSYNGTNMGGLSGLAYDAGNQRYFAISDDRSQINPARFYSMTIDLSGDVLQPGRINFTGVTTLLDGGGQPYAAGSLDPEGLALAPNGDVYVSSEGQNIANGLINPFVNRYSQSGALQGELSVPTKFNPVNNPPYGVRNNLAFETLTMTPGANSLFTATENALLQDGPAAGVGQNTNCRILRYALNGVSGAPAEEYVYVADAVADNPVPPGSFATSGLVDMLAIDDTHFLALERSFSTGVGNRIKLFEVAIGGATDVSGFDTLPGAFTPVSKSLLLDLDSLGLTLDNIEGLAFGPLLSDGRQSLILVSDNNFAATQFTQFLAFGVTFVPEPGSLALLALASSLWLRRKAR